MNTLNLNIRLFVFISASVIALVSRQLWVSFLYLFVSPRAAVIHLDKYLINDVLMSLRYVKLFFNIRYSLADAKDLKINKNKSYLIVSNHQSFVDILGIMIMHNRNSNQPIRFVAKKSLSHFLPHISQLMRILRYGFIDRKPSRKTIEVIRQLSRHCKNITSSMVIFPEGTRGKDGNLNPFNTSAVRAALIDHSMPILVAAVDGGVLFNKLFRKAHIKVHYKVKFLHIFEDANKKNAKHYIEETQKLISKQLTTWRAQKKTF